jgi:hypothetical protein
MSAVIPFTLERIAVSTTATASLILEHLEQLKLHNKLLAQQNKLLEQQNKLLEQQNKLSQKLNPGAEAE